MTRDELLKDDIELAKKEKKEKEESERRSKELHERMLREDTELANTLLDGELGEFIRRMNAEKTKKIKLNNHQTFRHSPDSTWEWTETYGDKFRLTFCPDPNYKPTKILIKNLRKAGFEAEAHTEVRGNVCWESDADGGGMVSCPGTHEEYSIIISW